MKSKAKRKVEHWLISLPIIGAGNMHCYLMTTKRTSIEKAANLMIQEAEKLVGTVLVPMFVSTGPLDADWVERLHGIMNEMPGFNESFKTAVDYHVTIFMAPPDVDAQLMAIH